MTIIDRTASIINAILLLGAKNTLMEDGMKRRFCNVTFTIMMILMLAALTGCNKKDDNQTKPVDTVKQEAQEPQATPEASTEDQDATAEAEGEAEVAETENTSGTEQEAAEQEVTTEQEPTAQVTPSLEGGIKDVYKQAGMIAGTCLSEVMISQSKYTNVITENFNAITLENLMKPDYILDKDASIAAGDIVVTFTPKTISLLDWAKSNGMSVRGHTLIWHSQTPDWIFYEGFDKTKGFVDRDTMLARMESYIKQTFELLDTLGYSEIFHAYDIVNEALNDNGTYRDSHWKKIIGDDYIWHAFNFADQYAPENIKLYYNDYNEQFKTQHFIKMAQSLVDESGRSLIDGIGCQGHLYTKDSIDDYIKMLKAYKTLGLEVQITELDVSLGTWQKILPPTEENLVAQGQYYYDLVNRIINENAAGTTNVSGITFWGFVDNLSWRFDRNPVLFDKDLNPKYAYYGAMQDQDKAGK